MITIDTLLRFAPRIRDVELQAQALEKARQVSSVTSFRRLCHFMGQVYVETGGLRCMAESLKYKDPARLDALFSAVDGIADARALIARGEEAIANRVYARRIGNGNEASGDGWRYRGSGYKQLTGRSNYREIGEIVGMDLEANPEQAREYVTAARVAFAFWDSRKCSAFADIGDTEGVTRMINGPALVGLAERRAATGRALGIWK